MVYEKTESIKSLLLLECKLATVKSFYKTPLPLPANKFLFFFLHLSNKSSLEVILAKIQPDHHYDTICKINYFFF